jgi:hypothetical protein
LLRISSLLCRNSARVEQFEQILAAVVDGLLREAFVELVAVVLLLLERDRIAVSGRRQRIVSVLLEVDAVGLDRQRALRDHDVALQRADALLEVDFRRLVGGEADRLRLVRLSPRARGAKRGRRAEAAEAEDGVAWQGITSRDRARLERPGTLDLSLRVLVLLSSSSPTASIIPRGSRIVTGLSVSAAPAWG